MSSPSKSPGPGKLSRRRRLVISLALALLFGAAAATPSFDTFNRTGVDVLLPLRHWAFGPLHTPQESDVVVVGIDEQSYAVPPFSNTPKVAWTPHLGAVIDAVDKAGAKAIGLDVVFPTSLDRPELLKGYDRPFLQALRQAADGNKIVLGEVQLSNVTQSPYTGQVIAARGKGNVRLLSLLLDSDNVVRRYLRGFQTADGGEVLSFGTELAKRAGAELPPGDFLINFDTGPGGVPTYSFADLYACASNGNTDYFAKAFAGKIVLFGETLDIGDRQVASKRLIWDEAADQRAAPARCTLPAAPDRFGANMDRATMPGVFIHAAAINTLTKNLHLVPLSRFWDFAIVTIAVFIVAMIFFKVPPLYGALIGIGVALLKTGAALLAFKAGIVAPLLPAVGLGVLTYTCVYAFRFFFEDREKRRIKRAFGHYLAPALVEQLSDDPDALKLGGERRHMTVMFTDIAGFTTLSEGLKDQPEKLVELMNRYLTVMSEVVEQHGGYVDKFIGDAVMAIWGAPVPTEQSERKAVDTALACHEALVAFNRDVVKPVFGFAELGTRIGIATGYAIAGNMGSLSRMNYTVTGDMVNLAARLEGANKEYGSSIMVSEETAKGLGDDYVLRRLDRLVVKGKTEPIVVFEVVGKRGAVPQDVVSRVKAFEDALSLHDGRRFALALGGFLDLAGVDEVAEMYAARCNKYLTTPPPDDWRGEFVMKTK